jgi:hypothetical protein
MVRSLRHGGRVVPAIAITLVLLALVAVAFDSSVRTASSVRESHFRSVELSGAGCPPRGSVTLLQDGKPVASSTADESGAFQVSAEVSGPEVEMACGTQLLVVRVADETTATQRAGIGVAVATVVPLVLVLAVLVLVISRRRRLRQRTHRPALGELTAPAGEESIPR